VRSADQSAATTMKQHTITTLPPSPEAERRARMIKYTIAMSVRVVCIFLMLFAQGWWLAVCAAGAIFLPYVAVVLANVGGGEQGVVERPGSIVPVVGAARPEQVGAPATDASDAEASTPREAPDAPDAAETPHHDASQQNASPQDPSAPESPSEDER